MKREVLFVAVAALLACSNKARTYEGSASHEPASPDSTQSAVIQPSDLSPEQIRLVQRSLVDRGFAVDPGGTFDDRTQTALMDFQRARGLAATGKLNQPTIDALGLDPRDVMPVRGTVGAPGDLRTGDEGYGAPGDSGLPASPGNSPYR
jgi:peptidoglycan hydrolase-like protein with peptidoglycan-binding domain